ncbi:MAG TPA: aldo/keto reductase, partial [Polyangiaceae bacterium]|nr:aldo/keto reductase [Polyangiaceae bacterium]
LLDERKMSFVAFSPLSQGILLGKYKVGQTYEFEEGDHRKRSSQFKDENLSKVLPKISRLKERFGDTPEKLARVALQYLLSYPCVACVIPGFRNLGQVQVNLAGADQPLSADDVAYVRRAVTD